MVEYLILTLPFYTTLFWSITLWAGQKKGNTPKLFLAIFMTVSMMLYGSHALFFLKDFDTYYKIDSLYTFASLAVYPLFYLYIRTLARDKPFKASELWILAPAFFFGITSFAFFLYTDAAEIEAYVQHYIYKNRGDYIFGTMTKVQAILYKAGRIVFTAQLIPVVWISIKLISSYEKKIREFYSDTRKRTLSWARNLLTATLFAGFFSALVNIAGRSYFAQEYTFLVFPSLIFSAILFSIGYLGNRQRNNRSIYSFDQLNTTNAPEDNNGNAKLENLSTELTEYMIDNKPFLNHDIRITDISKALNTNRSYISDIVNNRFNSSFLQWINRYRVNYSKDLLTNVDNHSLETIARISGFSTKNTFVKAFKRETGITPENYREKKNRGPAI